MKLTQISSSPDEISSRLHVNTLLDGKKKRHTSRLTPPQKISTGISMFPKLFGSARRSGNKKNQILKSAKIVDTGIETAQIN